jgi:hypothetical protein
MARKKLATNVPVSRRALLGRIDRALGKRGHRLRVSRHGGETTYFITSKTDVIAFDIGLEETGRKLGCLNPWETLVGDEVKP